MDFKDYSTYKLEDFVLDDSFRAYVRKTNTADQEFWSNWILFHPEKETEIGQAIAFVQSLARTPEVVPASIKKQELEKLLSRIDEQEDEEEIIPLQEAKQSFWYFWRGIAASLTGLILLGTVLGLLFLNEAPTITQYQTAYSQTKKIILPDSSVVVLNSNSKLKYNGDWDNNQDREVWVEGEAYFSVTHKKNRQKFRVTSSDGFQVEVLGTKFIVSDRKYKNSVVLESGKIKLTLEKQGVNSEEFIMKPGELIEFNSEKDFLVRKNVDATMYTSWKENVLVFEESTLADISALLYENYGITTIISDKKLAELKVSGVASVTDLEGFLIGLSKLHNFSIRKVKQQLHLEPVNNT